MPVTTAENGTVTTVSVVSLRTFGEVLQVLSAGLGRPNVRVFQDRLGAAPTFEALDRVVAEAVGPSGLIEFARFDIGKVLRTAGHRGGQLVRLLVGNPLVMAEMARIVPDAARYAPVSILILERSDGVHLSYDSMASLVARYGSRDASATAAALDTTILTLLKTAAAGDPQPATQEAGQS